MFLEFVQLMKTTLQMPFHVSTLVFANICIPKPPTSHPMYHNVMRGSSDFSIDAAVAIFSQSQIFWEDFLNFVSTKA